MAFERDITLATFGSTTFRKEDARKGLEPDECYYVANAKRVVGMTQFDPKRDPPPDFVVEIDITSRSIDRQPIYAALGVAEIWRNDGRRLHALELGDTGEYQPRANSAVFPFLPLPHFATFITRMMREPDPQLVLREFAKWVSGL